MLYLKLKKKKNNFRLIRKFNYHVHTLNKLLYFSKDILVKYIQDYQKV